MSKSSEMPDGPKVVWSRTNWPAVEGGPRALPGILVHELPDGWALVAWVDKEGWITPDAVYEIKYLSPVPDGLFENLVNDLRSSDWTGLNPD